MFHRGAKFRFEVVAQAPKLQGESSLSSIDSAHDEDVYGGETILDHSGDADYDLGYDDNQDTMFGNEDVGFDSSRNTKWFDDLE